MIFIFIFLSFYTSTSTEVVASLPCEYIHDNKLICRQTSFIHKNIQLNETIYSKITDLEWIESGAYIFSDNIINLFLNLDNVSLRSNTLTALTTIPFWSHLKHISHLDLSQNRLITITNRDFQYFHNLVSLNISLNFLTTIEPIWLLIPLHTIDLSQNGINTIGFIKIQNSTMALKSCLLEEIYLNHNRGLISFSQLETTITDLCPFIDRFQLIDNHWHCTCNDLIHSLKHYRQLILIDDSSQTLTGQCETPLALRHTDIQKLSEELVCDRLVLVDSILNDDPTKLSVYFSRHIIFLFLIGCIIGILIGLCLHYCTYRCYELVFYILFKCNREKILNNQRNSIETIQMNEMTNNNNLNPFIYYPNIQTDPLPTYSQVMNEIFYLDMINRQQNNDTDGEC